MGSSARLQCFLSFAFFYDEKKETFFVRKNACKKEDLFTGKTVLMKICTVQNLQNVVSIWMKFVSKDSTKFKICFMKELVVYVLAKPKLLRFSSVRNVRCCEKNIMVLIDKKKFVILCLMAPYKNQLIKNGFQLLFLEIAWNFCASGASKHEYKETFLQPSEGSLLG